MQINLQTWMKTPITALNRQARFNFACRMNTGGGSDKNRSRFLLDAIKEKDNKSERFLCVSLAPA